MTTPQTAVAATRIEDPLPFRLESESFGPSGLVITAWGELDVATVPALRSRMTAAIAGGVDRLVLDLRPIEFLDSVSVAAILHARQLLGDEGHLAVVLEPGSYTRMVFEIAGLPQCLDVLETRAAAVAHVSA